ncbi:MAG TPA: DinB family protein [Acidimicrobiales bacterium]
MAAKPLTTDDILARLADGPRQIAGVAAGVAPARLRARPAPDEWSANDVLAHLRSCSDMWGRCIEAMVADDHPTLKAVNPTTWIKQTDYPNLEFAVSFRAFDAQRAGLLALLEALPPDGWSRAATVTVAGKPRERTVHFYAEWLATHERPHLKQIARAIEAAR